MMIEPGSDPRGVQLAAVPASGHKRTCGEDLQVSFYPCH